MKVFVIKNVCLRCGYSNETELGLINKNDDAVYKCDYCKFIMFTSYMEDKE